MGRELKRTWLDQAIGWLSPQWGLQRSRARAAASVLLAYEGARTDRRTSGWTTSASSANAEIGPYLAKLRDRSRDLVRNNAYAANAIDELAGHAVGTGITAQPRLANSDQALAKQISEAWKIWVDECDADGQVDLYGLQDLVARGVFESGECLIRMRRRYSDDGFRVPMQLQLLEPDYLDLNKTEGTKTGKIIQGVEFDQVGRRIAYWLYPDHPGDVSAGYSRSSSISVRIPADSILHIYRKKRQQVRGVPWLAPVIITMRDDDEYCEAELVRKKIEACFATFVTQSSTDSLPLGETEVSDDQTIETVEPGMIKYLREGEDVKFAIPSGTGSGYRDFKRDIQTKMAVGIGLTYEQLTGDLSNVNYSSYRAGMISFRTKMDQFRWLCFVPMFCRPVSRWFADVAFAAGAIRTRDFRMEWSMPKYGSVDPEKDVNAIRGAIRVGTKTWPQAVGEEGYDPDEQIAEIQESNKKLDQAGIVLDCDPRRRTGAGAAVTQPEEQPKPDPTGSNPQEKAATDRIIEQQSQRIRHLESKSESTPVIQVHMPPAAKQEPPVVNIENRVEQPAPVVNIQAPPAAKQEPPVVNIENKMEAPVVHVHPPEIKQEPPVVNIENRVEQPAPVVNVPVLVERQSKGRTVVKSVERDDHGQITKITEAETPEE